MDNWTNSPEYQNSKHMLSTVADEFDWRGEINDRSIGPLAERSSREAAARSRGAAWG